MIRTDRESGYRAARVLDQIGDKTLTEQEGFYVKNVTLLCDEARSTQASAPPAA